MSEFPDVRKWDKIPLRGTIGSIMDKRKLWNFDLENEKIIY